MLSSTPTQNPICGEHVFLVNQFCKKPYWFTPTPAQHQTDIPNTSRMMMTSSNGNIFCFTALCVGNSSVTGEFPAQRPVTESFDVFFDLLLNKRLNKQSLGW